MTVWMFYRRIEGFDTTSLYAFTDNKKYAKEFREQRNPNTIFMFKRDKFTKAEWNALNTQFGKLRILEGHFYTKSEFFGRKKPVRVLCTAQEEESITLRIDRIWMDFVKYLFDPRAFKKEYLQALEHLLFIKFYCFYCIKQVQNADYFYEPYYSNFENQESFIYEEFKEDFYDYDELRVFLKLYKDTFTDTEENKG